MYEGFDLLQNHFKTVLCFEMLLHCSAFSAAIAGDISALAVLYTHQELLEFPTSVKLFNQYTKS